MGKLMHILEALVEQIQVIWQGPVTSSRDGKLQLPALVCYLSGNDVQCVHIPSEGAATEPDAQRITCADDAAAVLSNGSKKCLVIAVLPKSNYLVRFLDIPKVTDEEVHSALALQVEAILPRDFGPPEVAYRHLDDVGDGLCKYEVYVSRRGELKGYLEKLAELGVRPDIVLPSAAMWYRALNLADVDMLVASSGSTSHVEAAFADAKGMASVRTLQLAGDGQGSNLDAKLSECVRSALAGKGFDSPALRVGWIGQGCPSSAAGDRILVEDMSGDYIPSSPGQNTGAGREPLAHVSARCLSAIGSDCSLDEANLLPRETVLSRKRSTVYKAFAVGAASALLGLVLFYTAIQIAIVRYRRLNDQLSSKTALIRTEGEQAERRVSQLKAILDAQSAGRDFHDVISGLLAATPPGVCYSRVELTDTGQVRLAGQAESVSLPFLLPGRLQQEPIFRQAVLQSAGQQKRGAGSATEFLLDCTFRRRGKK